MPAQYRHFYLAPLVALYASTALSQDGSGALLLDPIVIHGELQDRELFDTVTSVAVEQGKDLERRGDVDVYDVVERTPGVSSTAGDRGFAIRGIDRGGIVGRGLLISTQVDGVALPNQQATIFGPYSAWDVEQVEVLRGPQSTQQGRNSLAGAVIIRSNDPDYEQLTKAHVEIGSRNTRRYAFTLNQPIIDDRVAFRFSAESFENDGDITNDTTGATDYDRHKSTTYRAKLRWDATDRLNFVFSLSHSDSSAGEDFIEERLFPERRVTLSNAGARESARHNIASLKTTYEFNSNLTLESTTSFYALDYRRIEDRDFSAADAELFDRTNDAETFSQDLRLRFDTGRGITGAVGLFYTSVDDTVNDYRRLDAAVSGGAPLPPGALSFDSITRDVYDEENIALYGEAEIQADRWLPGLRFTVGARYDYESVDFGSSRVTAPSTPQLPDFDNNSSTSFDAFLPKLGVAHDFADGQTIGLTLQRGYRAGGSQVNFVTGEVNEYDPEFTDTIELAYRGSFRGDTLRVAANAFYTEWTDQQVLVDGASGVNFDQNIENVGESELFGAELQIENDVSENFSLFASAAYVRTEYKDFVSNGQDFSGNSFVFAPELTASIGGSYRWDNGLTLGVDASYTDSAFGNVENTADEATDSRFLINAQLTYDAPGGWTAGIYARNLLDRDYATARLPLTSTNASGSSVEQRSFVRGGEPRTVGVLLTKTF
ncbi:TonB-dependent receptor plug domain-containing protein [Epibacterium sp. SM1979]|uniref:TonB-dependent receptor plug domain-containing protein n=1 Tax=Tritonibacter litoralis TaxID=2662264 RepID=A0A843YKT7_9RHOB|nr:TonB-dependent receptor [Tritonibacter litoralis]MQQ10285.1 TonB-dependent receptor plug domain-containing protein [Tritonibacter litoralis]